MKLIIQQELEMPETEITIRCAHVDARLQKLIDTIRQYGFSLTGYQDGREYQLALEEIYFLDSTDGKTFLYLEKEVYASRETLGALEEKLAHTSFVRISKNCIVNTTFLQSVRPLPNHRLEGTLVNGEKLVIARSYIERLKKKLQGERL